MKKDLYLYNTASRSKELFKTPHDTVGIYACGPTVYNYAHIGNLRTYLWEDVLVRTLRALQYDVTHVVNITDVGHLTSDADTGEDKMEKGALREGRSVWEIAAHYTDVFKDDLRKLNIREPDIWAKATDHIPEMIALVRRLEEQGFTYRTGDGLYFDTAKFPEYCVFAGLDPESLRAGSRIDMGEKKHVTDFALWKVSPKESKRQMEWESPWGIGFPGWHIECSAMALEYLRQPVDIHCGGQEHVAVHHTNEIAQVEAATGNKFVNYWIHGQWLVCDDGKMAKSGGNALTLDRLAGQGVPPLAYRYFTFSAHHRTPLTFSHEGILGAAHGLKNLKKLVAAEQAVAAAAAPHPIQDSQSCLDRFWDALCDDLNVPKAVAAIWDIVHGKSIQPSTKIAAIKRADEILGLDLLVPDTEPDSAEFERNGMTIRITGGNNLEQTVVETIVQKAVARCQAKRNRDFPLADQIRNELNVLNVAIKDLADGTTECLVSHR